MLRVAKRTIDDSMVSAEWSRSPMHHPKYSDPMEEDSGFYVPKRQKGVWRPEDTSMDENVSPFAHVMLPEVNSNSVLDLLDRSKRRRVVAVPAFNKEKLFSLEEVQEIVARAVEEAREILKQEYDKILVAEKESQYETFAQTNQIYLQNHANHESSYIS